jgi:WD40 repeat protein
VFVALSLLTLLALIGGSLAVRQAHVATAARLKSEWLAYASQISLAQRQWEDGNVKNAHDTLNRCQSNLRGWEHEYLHTLFNQNQTTLNGHSKLVTSVAFSPDGTRIVSGSQDTTAKVWDASSGQETLTLEGHSYPVMSVAFSPDGTRIVSGSHDETVKVWDASSGQEFTLKGHTGWVTSVAFSPDGTRIVSGSEDRTLKVWEALSGQETLTLKGHSYPVTSVAFSPDGRRIASGGGDYANGEIKVWDARPWTVEQRAAHQAGVAAE